jgi:hypothetical protein
VKRTKTYRMLVVVLLMLGALALSACSSTPLPPLFYIGRGGAAQPAAPAAAAPAPAIEVAAAPAEAPTVAPPAAVTEPAPVAAAAAITPTVAPAEAITITAPVTASVVITPTEAPTRAAELAAQPAATATRVPPAATPTRVAPTATPTRVAPTATRAPARPTATPTPQWPQTLIITADEIEEGATSVPGLQITGLDVQFGNNTMTMRFDSLRYSFVSLRNVTIEGRFVVNNCDVDFVADRINPRNLATGAIPGFINQSLDQQLGAWCVEALTVQPGQLVATVRPR